jgi:hypothetical protein
LAASVAVSKPIPNSARTAHICHSLLTAFIHLPKKR